MIYIIQFSIFWEKMLPPIFRKAIQIAWGAVVLKPLQSLRDLVFENFANGSYYSAWDYGTPYVVGDRVYYTDLAVYECVEASLHNLPTSTLYWKKILDSKIGVRERIKYNSQKILFEYHLNKSFDIPNADPQIYIDNNNVYNNVFLLGETGEYSSTLAEYSTNQYTYLGLSQSYDFYNFTIFVPLAFFNTLGVSDNVREMVIRNYADRFVLAGMNYNVLTY